MEEKGKTRFRQLFTRRGWCEYKGHDFVNTYQLERQVFTEKVGWVGVCMHCNSSEVFIEPEDMKDSRWTTRQKWFWYGLVYPTIYALLLYFFVTIVI